MSAALDFYNVINKTWIKASKIRSNASSYSVFDVLEKEIQDKLIDIIKYSKDSNDKFGQFVYSIYNGRINDLNFINDFINSISINSKEELFRIFGELNIYGLKSPIEIIINNDSRNTDIYSIYIIEPKLTLIKEEYKIQSELYKKYNNFLNEIAKESDDIKLGNDFINIETRLSAYYYNYEER